LIRAYFKNGLANGGCNPAWAEQAAEKGMFCVKSGELAPAEAGIASEQVSGGIAGRSFILRGSATPVDD
jgi:hypothetical protein